MSILFAFTAGAVATVNPCGFALLPVWFSKRLAEGGTVGPIATHLRALKAGVGATLGFILIFGLAGTVLGLGASWLGPVLPVVGFGVGVIVVLAGLASLTGIFAGVSQGAKICRTVNDRHGSFVFGLGYGLLSLSCTLPIFLAAVGMSLTENPLATAANLFAYAAGMGTVLTMIGLGAGFSRSGFGAISPRGHQILQKASAALIIIAGLYVAYYWGRVIFGDVMAQNNLTETGDRVSSLMLGWLSSLQGRWLTGLAFILLIVGTFVGVAINSMRRSGGTNAGEPAHDQLNLRS